MGTNVVRTLGTVLRVGGSALALWFLFLLSYFLITDGVTLWGENYRANDEFLRYWTTRLVPVLVGGAMVWSGAALRRREGSAPSVP